MNTTEERPEAPDELTIEARLRGASQRLQLALDPVAPATDVTTTDVTTTAAPAGTLPGGSVIPLVRHGANRRTWALLSAAAAVALIATSVAVTRDRHTTVANVAARAVPPTVPSGASGDPATTDTTVAAATETVAAATETVPAASATTIASPTTAATAAQVANDAAAAAPDTTAAAAASETTAAAAAAPDEIAAGVSSPADRKTAAPSAAPPVVAGRAACGSCSTETPFPEPTYPPPTVIVSPVPTPTGINPETSTAADPQSTFALDVDTGSYTRLRDRLRTNGTVDPAEVRTEELINAFRQDYADPQGATFGINVDGARVPFLDPDQRVVRIGVQGKSVGEVQRKDVSLTFVIDVSGSMEEGGKLEIVKAALGTLVDRLRPSDTVAIVAFSDDAWVALPPTAANDRNRILNAIATLSPTDSTNAEAGLRLGYQLARQSFSGSRINRVVLASDGVANVGPTGPEVISAEIREQAGKGIQLVTVGVGQGAYNDQMMEQLADRGEGFYTYIDGPEAADRVFSQQLVGTLQSIALDAKAQVTFDPRKVVSYRLLGYENRAVADQNFRNDHIVAGAIGAGHTSTALYIVRLAPNATGSLGQVNLRWMDPDTKKVSESAATLPLGALQHDFTAAAPRLQQDVYIAAWAEILRGGPIAARVDAATLAARAGRLVQLFPEDSDVRDLVELITRTTNVPSTPLYPPTSPTTISW